MNFFSCSKLPLTGKILAPLLCLFIGVGGVSIFSVGYLFTKERANELKRETANATDHTIRQFEHYLEALRLKSAALGNKSVLTEAVIQQDSQALQQTLLPLQTSLKLDLVRIVDQNANTLVDLRSSALFQVPIDDREVINTGKSGLVFASIIIAQDSTPILVEVTSIKSRQAVIGSLIVGQALTPNDMLKIIGDRRQEIMLMKSSDILVSTAPTTSSCPWIDNLSNNASQLVQIGNQPFLAQRFPLTELVDDQFHLLILTPLASLRKSQRQIWGLTIAIALFGGASFIALGVWITRLMTRRLEKLTQATQALAEGRLTTRLPVQGHDEMAILAKSFNGMAEQLAQRDLQIQSQVKDLELLVKELQQMPQLVHTEKMAGLGQMVAGVAHEINNPVNFIYGNVPYAQKDVYKLLHIVELYQKHFSELPQEIIEKQEELDIDFVAEDLPKLLDSIQSGAERIQKIVLSLRNFSRKDEAEKKAIDIHEGIENTLILLGHRLKSQSKYPRIAVIRNYGTLPHLLCYAGELNQVFMNVLSNSIDALEDQMIQHYSGPSGKEPLDPQIHIKTECTNADWVTVYLKDNGPGIPKEIRDKLFDPFFTTKEVGKGTGLGLSISYQIIVEKHGGNLWCNSGPGKGTEFVIQIPIIQNRSIR